MNTVFMIVPTELVYLVWKEAREKLYESVDSTNGRISFEDMLRNILSKESQLWIYVDKDTDIMLAALVTSIHTYSNGLKILRMNHVGGRGSGFIENFKEIGDELNKFASENDCEMIEAAALPYWDRFSDAMKFEKTHSLFEREVTHG